MDSHLAAAVGRGRGRGGGSVDQSSASAGCVREEPLSVSWNPSWLGSGVSPPSFGVGVGNQSEERYVPGRGRGRANALASLLGASTPAVGRHPTAESRLASPDVSSSEEEEAEMLVKLQDHHKEWSREMERMQEQGRELEQAMKFLCAKQEK